MGLLIYWTWRWNLEKKHNEIMYSGKYNLFLICSMLLFACHICLMGTVLNYKTVIPLYCFVYWYIASMHICVSYACVMPPENIREGVGSLWIGITWICGTQCWSWESNPGRMEEELSHLSDPVSQWFMMYVSWTSAYSIPWEIVTSANSQAPKEVQRIGIAANH